MSAPVVFITGAAGGVGRAIARRFAADGYAMAMAGRAQGPLDELARDLGRTGASTATALCDVTDAGQVQRAVADAERQLGPLDVLVNNAGASDSAPFASMDDGLWERMLAVNLTGTYHVMRAVAPGMFARGRGRIINIASSAGKQGFAYTAAYAAAKHGVLGLTRSVAIEAAPHGVTVNAICPGWIDTPMTDTSIARIVEKTGRSPEEVRRALERMNPQGRLIQPEEVAALAAFLASPDAQGINGQSLDL
jgi:NAD(P)-dependent dehydrogenase (short-subunit alcohol dehydrogenase family)